MDNIAEFMLGECDAHLNLVRSKDCAVANGDCQGDIVPAHTKPVGRNPRKRPSFRHFSCVPLCGGFHHQEQEGKTLEFNLKYNIDLSLYALQLTIETLTGIEACWHNNTGKR